MVGTIDDFRSQLVGGGARSNQFKVEILDPPVGSGIDTRNAAFLCTATNLPGMSIEEIELPFRGRTIRIAGDRDFADPWTVTFLNDTSFAIRNAIENWQNKINDLATAQQDPAINTSSLAYCADLTVTQLDRDNTALKVYKFINAWPQSIAQIDLASASANEIESFEVTWRYQHFITNGIESTSAGQVVLDA